MKKTPYRGLLGALQYAAETQVGGGGLGCELPLRRGTWARGGCGPQSHRHMARVTSSSPSLTPSVPWLLLLLVHCWLLVL